MEATLGNSFLHERALRLPCASRAGVRRLSIAHALEGSDGCMLYRNVYSIHVPGSMRAFCIHSGRIAAKHAVENCR